MTISQEGRRIQLKTVLDTDEFPGGEGHLVPGLVQGAESFSLPYSIDLTMYGERSIDVAPANLINTPATVRIRVEDETEKPPFTYQVRKGIFQTFSLQPRIHFREPAHRDLDVYFGRLVPAFLIMAQEVRNRVFENMTVIEIIKACMGRFQGIDLGTYISEGSFAALAGDDVSKTKLEHAIQYNESTFNFLSRLMNRCSIWYTFDHDSPGNFETMVIGKGPKSGFTPCADFRNFVDPRDLPNLEDRKRWRMLTGLANTYTPAVKLERVGEFNTIRPSNPLQSSDSTNTVAQEANIISTTIGKERSLPDTSQNEPATSFIQESFPDLGAFDNDDTTQDAHTTLEIAEAQVEVLSGISANASFMAGRVFGLVEGKDEKLKDRNYLITQMSFAAYDRNYLYIVRPNAAEGLGAVINDLVIQPFTTFLDTVDNIPPPDVTTAMATQGLAEYTRGWYNYAKGLDDEYSISKYDGSNRTAAVINYTAQVLGKVVSAVADYSGSGIIPFVYTVLRDLVTLVEKIIDGVLWAIAKLVEAIIAPIIGIAALVQFLLGKPVTAQEVWTAIEDAKDWLKNKIHPFFRPQYVDGYSASFNATAVARPGQRQGAGIPLPAAQKTVINGPHLATVIGQDGMYNGTTGILHGIYADKLGRVRIRFPWDRSPAGSNKVTLTSTSDQQQFLYGEQTVWVRVSEGWAGGYGFGSQFLPRVGDEVVVSFVDGDPDRPVVTGRLYNPGKTGKSNLPFPVPGQIKKELHTDKDGKKESDTVTNMKDLVNIASTDNQFTRSGIKTRSTPPTGPGKPDGFHMLRFEDKSGKEQLLLRSQGRLDVTALGTRYETIGGDRNLTVGWIDSEHQAVGGNYIAKVYQDYHLHIGDAGGPFNGGHRFERVEKDYHLQVKSDTNFNLDGDWNVSVGGKASITADTIVLKATKSVTVIVGNSIIVVQADGIYNEAAIHYEQSGGDGQAANDAVLKLPKDPQQADAGKDPPEPSSGSS